MFWVYCLLTLFTALPLSQFIFKGHSNYLNIILGPDFLFPSNSDQFSLHMIWSLYSLLWYYFLRRPTHRQTLNLQDWHLYKYSHTETLAAESNIHRFPLTFLRSNILKIPHFFRLVSTVTYLSFLSSPCTFSLFYKMPTYSKLVA